MTIPLKYDIVQDSIQIFGIFIVARKSLMALKQPLFYVMVGGLNTLVTAVVIYTAMYNHVNPYISNALGYAFGIIFSFVLNSTITFKSKITTIKLFKFITTCLICYLINISIMRWALIYTSINGYICQLFGMVAYIICGYLLNKYWSMK